MIAAMAEKEERRGVQAPYIIRPKSVKSGRVEAERKRPGLI